MKSRLLVSAIGVPILLYAVLWAPPVVMEIGLMALCGCGAYELMRCVGKGTHMLLACMVAVAAAAIMYPYVRDLEQVPAILFLFVVLLFICAVFSGGKIPAHSVMAALLAVTLIPYAFSSFLRLYRADFHRIYLLLPFVFSFMSDTGGYFVGRAFGKHKLAPAISPKKTVEGAFGGLLGNAVGGVLFALAADTWFGERIDYIGIVVLGLACSVLAQLGDLSFSLIKREYGIKDYGKIFLEHGGVLDRFDSVIFVAPALTLLLPLLN